MTPSQGLSCFDDDISPQVTKEDMATLYWQECIVKSTLLHTVELHGLDRGVSTRIMFPGLPHLPLVVHVAKSGPCVECVPRRVVHGASKHCASACRN